MLTAWIPLQDVTLNMGPLLHINGSHKWLNDAKLKSHYSFSNPDLKKLEHYLDKERSGFQTTPMVIKKGQVSFHNCNTIHCSAPNTSAQDRIVMALHLQDQSNSYQRAFKDNGDLIEIGYDKLCSKDSDGHPNYKDEKVFPLLFKK